MYGTVATTLNNSELKIFCNAYDSIFAKLFHSSDKTVIKQCQYYSGYWPLNILYDYNRYNFLNKLVKSDCLVKGLEIDNQDYRDYENIQRKYNIFILDSFATIRFKFWTFFEHNIDVV